MEIIHSKKSKFKNVDFNNLSFGTFFSDHMFMCKYSYGSWKNPKILPYGSISLDPSTSSFHYGQAIFEGMKAYKDSKGKVWLFRPEENFERMNRSSLRLNMPELPKDLFFKGLTNLLRIDSEWIKPGIGNSLYIRPFIFASSPNLQAAPSKEYMFFIICCPVKSYYGGRVDVLISEKYSRAASGGVGYAKAAGNYAAQFYPTSLAEKEGCNQIIWTDANNHEYLEEAGTMNVFFRINDTLITSPLNDRILDGVTRKSVIQLADNLKIKTEVRPIKVEEIISSHKKGELKEIFGAGTAVVVCPISSFKFNDKKYEISQIKDSFADILKEKITSIQYNLIDDPFGWRFPVN
ncbi:MAG: branched-chain amino acid aminotransferase [Flavobacteriaceae bacterium]|jgi:branched-chain amino acid aminotransferase|nr:branched-chain amino acid aminotransferase [Flavobacteriaceae bacterium]